MTRTFFYICQISSFRVISENVGALNYGVVLHSKGFIPEVLSALLTPNRTVLLNSESDKFSA